MNLEDFAEQGYVYHVINIADLKRTLKEGIRFDDKHTYTSKYLDFHIYFDRYKPEIIPDWVERKKAIFASIRFREGHLWHSHSAILRVKIQKQRCWVCNENLANCIYEPFMLQDLEGFAHVKAYIKAEGKRHVEHYWNNSLSYMDNLKVRLDKKKGYDAEILIMHSIPPEHVECMYIVSDHRIMSFEEWKEYLRPGESFSRTQYSRYWQPDIMSSPWNTPGSQ